jgi:DNA-directed RNA polymerase specialized sigma24 family protein
MSERRADDETVRSSLLVKQAKMARVIELHRVEGLSTFCIAARLTMTEDEVFALLEEGTRGR